MQFSQATTEWQTLAYTTVGIQGCSEAIVGFEFLQSAPQVSKRRYANKVLVHECVPGAIGEPLDLSRVEFMATSDPCYKLFEIFKSSDIVDTVDPTIEILFNSVGLATGVLVNFATTETCGLPLRMSYRMYGYYTSGGRILLSNGNLYVTPCRCNTDVVNGAEPLDDSVWTDVQW